MPGRYSKFIIPALAILVSLQAHAASRSASLRHQRGREGARMASRAAKPPSHVSLTRSAVRALLFGRAYYAVEQYRYDDAIADLNAALAADPDNPDYLRERAYVHGELSNFGEAIADLDRVIKLQPDEVHALSRARLCAALSSAT